MNKSEIMYRSIFVGLLITVMVSAGSSQTPGKDVKFKKFHLWDEFYTEGSTVADVTKDGKTEIIPGARWFDAPDSKVHDIWKHNTF